MTIKIEAKGIRKIIAERMLESWHISPRVSYSVSVDTTNLKRYREELNSNFIKDGNHVTINHILIMACSEMLKEFSYANSSFDGKTITVHDDINIGLAVSIDNGLMVPNIKNVQEKTLDEIVLETNRIIKGAQNMKLNYDDITGGTFTISNLGMFGIESFSPIINQPELAILGVNAIIDKPVALNGEVVIRPMMTLDLVADHRVIDGVYAAKMLASIKTLLEEPDRMNHKLKRAV